MNTVEKIVQEALDKNLNTGEEHFLGLLQPLAKTCGAETEDAIFEWMQQLGTSLGLSGLIMMSGRGKPSELWAVKRKRVPLQNT